MKTTPSKIPILLSLFFFTGFYSSILHAVSLSDLSKKFEDRLLLKLVQAKQGATINAFTSDGCSGGLSAGWETLSNLFPPFNAHFGRLPPWQDCCLAHDKVYWRGETDDGYLARKQADQQLRQCVIDTGIKLAPSLAQRYQLSEREIERGFRLVAMTMYRAVRLGGRPCSGLPWRWGYGWPPCNLFYGNGDD